MNRKEQLAHAAWLHAAAAMGVQAGGVEDRGCTCWTCQMIRKGVCLPCAASIHAQIIEAGPGTHNFKFETCSYVCGKGLRRWWAEDSPWGQR